MTKEKVLREAAKLQSSRRQDDLTSNGSAFGSSARRSKKKKKRRSRPTPDGLPITPRHALSTAPRSRWRVSKSRAARNAMIKKFCEDCSVPEPLRGGPKTALPFAAQTTAVFHCPFTELDIAVQVDKVEDFLA